MGLGRRAEEWGTQIKLETVSFRTPDLIECECERVCENVCIAYASISSKSDTLLR